MILFAIKLILAHLLGDFLLQPVRWVAGKEVKKIRSKYLYYHIGIHLACLLLLLQFQMKYWVGILLIALSHYIIDLLKLYLQKPGNKRWMFFADQVAHLLLLAVVVNIYFPFHIKYDLLFSVPVLLFVCFIVFITNVTGVIMQVIISRWRLSNWLPTEQPENEGLQKAGMYIGILERLFVFGFIIMHHWEGVGFLIAAKSIFRFGDLTKAKDRKLTEYILIGTLLSFGIAITCGVIYTYLSAQFN